MDKYAYLHITNHYTSQPRVSGTFCAIVWLQRRLECRDMDSWIQCFFVVNGSLQKIYGILIPLYKFNIVTAVNGKRNGKLISPNFPMSHCSNHCSTLDFHLFQTYEVPLERLCHEEDSLPKQLCHYEWSWGREYGLLCLRGHCGSPNFITGQSNY